MKFNFHHIMKTTLPNKHSSPWIRILFGAAWLPLAISLSAQTFTRYDAQPAGSKVKLAGDSSLHEWTMEGTIIGGFLEIDSAVKIDTAEKTIAGLTGGKVNTRAQVSIPIRSIKSGKSSMDSAMQDAMNQKTFPKIEYRLSELVLKDMPHAAGTPFQFESTGELSMNGVTNKISMPVTIDRVDKSKLKITGSVPLKMTAFHIKPPTLTVLGLGIKTDDNVKVSVDWLVAPQEKTGEAK